MGDAIPGSFVQPVVPDKCVKSHDSILTRSREIPPAAVGGGTFDCFFSSYYFRSEVDSDIISGVVVENIGWYVCVKFGCSVTNGFRYIRGSDFV